MLVLILEVPPFPLLAAVGHAVWPQGILHGERRFEAYDLIYCAGGVLYMEENGVKYEVSDGKMLLLEPEHFHRGYRPTEVETEVYWIHFRYPKANVRYEELPSSSALPLLGRTDQDIETLSGAVNVPKFTAIDKAVILPLFAELLQLHGTLTFSRSFELQVTFGRLLLALQDGLKDSRPQPLSARLSERVAAYLAEGLGEPFSSEQMERDLHYHFDYLARCLKKHTGMSPLTYRHHLQIERAKRLLIHSDDALASVGEQCGFRDVNYFSRLFKRLSFMTPGEYRARFQIFRRE